MPFPTNMFALLSVSAGPRCPGSDAWVHARTSVHVDASAPCRRVRDEMLSRVRAQRDGRWSDPHNNGTYTLLDDSDPGTLLFLRPLLANPPSLPQPYPSHTPTLPQPYHSPTTALPQPYPSTPPYFSFSRYAPPPASHWGPSVY